METQANDASPSPAYGCPVEVTLEATSGKWKCVILWWLRRGEKRFGELMLLIPVITRKVLTGQLRELESTDLIRRQTYQEKPPRVEYFLTKRGQSLRPLVELMCEWGKDQLPMFELGIMKLSGLKVLALAATDTTADALQTVLAETCEADLTLLSQATSLDRVIETFDQLQPEILIAEFSADAQDLRPLTQYIKQVESPQAKSVFTIGLTHNSSERSQAFIQGFRMTFVNPFEVDELVGAIAGLTGRLHPT